jgi:hypothetical protein
LMIGAGSVTAGAGGRLCGLKFLCMNSPCGYEGDVCADVRLGTPNPAI